MFAALTSFVHVAVSGRRNVANSSGKLNYSSAGTGGNNHFAASLFASSTDTSLTHIPYKGVAPASIALVSGEVEMRKFLSTEAAEPWPLSPGQLADLLPREIERYRKIAKAAGIEAE